MQRKYVTTAQLVLLHSCEIRFCLQTLQLQAESYVAMAPQRVLFLSSAGHGMSLGDINAAHAMSLK